ncbi:hypothetical protein GE21DRAFT_1097651 [Neurospora crassa]|nr:hypothetical protein GE21DRAFT_1097651 [Neurospora crassa]
MRRLIFQILSPSPVNPQLLSLFRLNPLSTPLSLEVTAFHRCGLDGDLRDTFTSEPTSEPGLTFEPRHCAPQKASTITELSFPKIIVANYHHPAEELPSSCLSLFVLDRKPLLSPPEGPLWVLETYLKHNNDGGKSHHAAIDSARCTSASSKP